MKGKVMGLTAYAQKTSALKKGDFQSHENRKVLLFWFQFQKNSNNSKWFQKDQKDKANCK